jgi:hypothetical protein
MDAQLADGVALALTQALDRLTRWYTDGAADAAASTDDRQVHAMYAVACALSRAALSVADATPGADAAAVDAALAHDRVVVTARAASPLDWLALLHWCDARGRLGDVRFVVTDRAAYVDTRRTLADALVGAGVVAGASPRYEPDDAVLARVDEYLARLARESARYVLVVFVGDGPDGPDGPYLGVPGAGALERALARADAWVDVALAYADGGARVTAAARAAADPRPRPPLAAELARLRARPAPAAELAQPADAWGLTGTASAHAVLATAAAAVGATFGLAYAYPSR